MSNKTDAAVGEDRFYRKLFPNVIRTIFVLFILLLSVGCQKINGEERIVEYENTYYDINDDVIQNSDMYTIIEPLWWSVNIYDGEDEYNKDLDKFTTEQKYIFAIEWYIAEVNNGGHDQFYFNSTGIVWEDAMKGFEAIGLMNNYEIIKESIERLGGYPNKDREKRQEQLDEYGPDFSDLDDRFYESEKDIETTLLSYIRANKEKFYFKGNVSRPKF